MNLTLVEDLVACVLFPLLTLIFPSRTIRWKVFFIVIFNNGGYYSSGYKDGMSGQIEKFSGRTSRM